MATTLPSIESRSIWGARYPNGDLDLSGPAAEVFLHHTVTLQLDPSASANDERAQMRSIESIGQARFKTGISYNVIVFPSGRAYQGVSFNRRGTHTGGRNSTTRSICLAGNYDIHHPTDEQISTVSRLYRAGKGTLWVAGANIRGHRDVSQTACPGRNAYARLPEIRSGAGFVNNPKPPNPAPGKNGLQVDGYWGSSTTMALQHELGTTADGIVSSQPSAWRGSNKGLTTGWEWVTSPKGSRVIAAMQGRLNVTTDGMIGPNTIKALQRHLGTVADGEIWKESPTIEALQRRLNAGKF